MLNKEMENRCINLITIRCIGVVAGTVLMLSGSSALAQWKLDVAPEYYYWREDANGMKLLDESGFRYGLELSYKERQDEGWLSATRFKAYYGSVDYNGGTWGGTPIKATSVYYGGLGEFRYGYRWGLDENQYLDLMGGVGVEDWYRHLNGSGGYGENWTPIYLKAGFELCPEETGWIGTLGVKVPVYTIEMVDATPGLNAVTLHPGTRPSGYAEAGYQFTKNLSLVAYFDSYWFAASPPANAGPIDVYQPESLSYAVGVKLGWTF
jgi:hypothetical protein